MRTDTVADYIFVISSIDRPVTITGLAKPHETDKLDPGIPRKGVCGSALGTSAHGMVCIMLESNPTK